MIQCGGCGFSVTDNMKHSLISNSCPACGHALFSDEDMNLLSSIQGGVAARPFSFNFTEETVYDVSLFIFNELKYGLGQQFVADALAKRSKGSLPVEASESTSSEDDPIAEIRKEIEIEYQEEIEEIIESQEEEDIFSKAERLRRIAQQRNAGVTTAAPRARPRISANSKTGTMVKRSQ